MSFLWRCFCLLFEYSIRYTFFFVCFVRMSFAPWITYPEVEAAVFCLKFVWPWKMDSSGWCYQVCNENGGASFSTQFTALLHHETVDFWVGSCKQLKLSLEILFFFCGLLCPAVITPESSNDHPWKWSDLPKEKQFSPRKCWELGVWSCLIHPFKPIPSMYGIFTYNYPKNQPNVGKYTIYTWMVWENWGESWKNEQKTKPLTPSGEISRRSSWVLRCLPVSSVRMGALL